MRIVFDMETQDPDDFVTLLLLLGHPRVDLVAVTINPGTREQVGWVRRAFDWFGVDLPVGVRDLDHPKPAVSGWHSRAYGPAESSGEAVSATDVLVSCCDEDTTLLTGAPLHNIGAALQAPGFHVGRWVCQGGFAGEGIVPAELQLPKFQGLHTCPTFNLNGKPLAALRALADARMGTIHLVSKNVCHAVNYDNDLHRHVASLMQGHRHLELIHQGMAEYLRGPAMNDAIDAERIRLILDDGSRETLSLDDAVRRAAEQGLDLIERRSEGDPRLCSIGTWTPADEASFGKILHDPFAACCAIDPSIATWSEVEMFREHGEWGARQMKGSGTWITTDWSPEDFRRVLLETG